MKYAGKLPSALAAACAVLLFSGTAAFALSQAGTNNDPLVSQSYAQTVYKNEQIDYIQNIVKTELDSAQTEVTASLNQLENSYTDSLIEQKILAGINSGTGYKYTVKTFTSGSAIQLGMGSEICITSGSACLESGELINITTGQSVYVGTGLVRNQLYFSPNSLCTIKMTSPVKANVAGESNNIAGSSPVYTAQYTKYADALSDLGLFTGSDKGYELERVSTRAEGLVMLLRMLGEEKEAANYKGAHPFTDVPAWADRYVAYAYEKGYTSGISATEYGSSNSLTVKDYMTFLLRALGYSDRNGDFSWSTAPSYAVTVGIISQNECDIILQRGSFYRDDVVYTSYKALMLTCKGENIRLCDKLVSKGIFTLAQLKIVQNNL